MKISAIVAVGLLAAPALAETFVASGGSREVAGAVFVLRGYDPAARTVTLSGETGTQVLRVDDRTLLAASQLSPGETLLVSYRYNANAEAEVTLRRIPPGYVTASDVRQFRVAGGRSPSRVVVLSVDAEAGFLTVRDARGDAQRLAVDETMATALAELRPGDRVHVDLDAGRVVGISRSR